jgi:hypothetical protein
MKLLARLDAVAGRMNPYLAIVAIALGIIDLTVLVAHEATDGGWRRHDSRSPVHATAAPGRRAPPQPPAIL